MTAPSSPSRKFEALLTGLVERVDALERGGRATQLGNSSLDGTALTVRDADGYIRATWGQQPDGTVGTVNRNGPPPPRPNTPSVTGIMTGLDVAWNGELTATMPADFAYVRVHLSAVEGFIPGDSNRVGTLFNAGSVPVAPLEPGDYWVRLIAVTTSGKESEPSLEARGTPAQVVADQVLDGIITETSLAANAVSEAKLAAGAVTATKVADDAISTPKLVAGAVAADKLAADSVNAGKIAADAVTAREIAALAVTAAEIAANAVTAGKISAGSVDATKLAAQLVLASRLIAGDPSGTRVELSEAGMKAVRADGQITFSVDSATGDTVSMGEYYTSRSGERLAMNVAGLSEPTIRAYPRRGTRYADLRSLTYIRPEADYASWEFRLPLLTRSLATGVVDFMCYDENFVGIQTTRLRYRGFSNSSGVLHPGMESAAQDVGWVLYNGRFYVTNAANTQRRDLDCNNLTVRSINNAVSNGMFNADFYGRLHGEVGAPGEGWTLYGVVQPASRRDVKRRIRPLTGSPLAAVADLEWDLWEYLKPIGEQHGPGDDQYVGPMVDDMINHPVWRHAVRYDEHGEPVAYDQSTLVGILGAALAEQGRRNTELTSRLERLETTCADR